MLDLRRATIIYYIHLIPIADSNMHGHVDPLVDGIIYPEVRDRMILLKGPFSPHPATLLSL